MVKMILALPEKIDADKFTDTVKEMLMGRYGKESRMFSALVFKAVEIEKPGKILKKGFSSKRKIRFYEIGAELLDPVMLVAMEDLMALMTDVDYLFVNGEEILPRDWWIPSNKNFQMWHGKRHYCEDLSVETARDEYDHKLELLSAVKKIA